MNPKSTANLDPKLREAYERIMGTTVPQPSSAKPATTPNNVVSETPKTPPIAPVTSPQLPTQPSAQQVNTPPKLEVQEVAQEPINIQTPPQMPFPPKQEHPLTEMVQSPQTTSSLDDKKNPFAPNPLPQTSQMVNLTNSQVNSTPKKKNKLMPVFLSVGGIGFFILYAVIWSKVFGLF